MSSAPEAAVLAELDVTVPGFYLRPDYFEVLGWLRANARVRRSANGMWLVSTYEEIREISRQPERFSSRRGALVNDPVRLGEPNDDATIEVTDNPSDEVLGAIGEFFVFLDGHVRAKFDSPGDDLLSLLAASTVGDRPLPPEEVQMFCLTLVVAGNETTRSLLSGAALALAEHPDQRAALAADPDLLPGAIEEALRWVTPIQAFCRTATEDCEVAGASIAAGDYLVLLHASGNRDEAAFGPTADRFDTARPASPAHVAFGFGEHLCLGAGLARLEARLVLEELLRRHPAYEVVGDPVYVPSTLTRSLGSLPVRLA